MRETVEVHSNPRETKCEVKLSQRQVKAGLAYKPKKKKKTELALVKEVPKKPRKKSYTKKNDEGMMAAGAILAAAVEVFIIRNLEFSDKIPFPLRRYSGLAMAVLGYALGRMKGVKGDMRAFYKGFMAAGIFLAGSNEMVEMRKDQTMTEAKKFVEEALAKVEGLGYMPAGPRMTTGQAMARLGAQTRVPFHPHGMGSHELGEFDYSDNPGMGEFVNLPEGAVTDPSLDPRLDPAGLGEFVDSDDADMWAEGQIAFAEDDHNDIWGQY